jgi:hypothetical protein
MVGILVYVREFSLNICGRIRRRKMLVTLQDPADDPRRKSEGGNQTRVDVDVVVESY